MKNSKKRKKLIVGIFVDFMGSGLLTGQEIAPEEELKNIQRLFQEFLGEQYDFRFITSFQSLLEITSRSLDVFVVDYGGLLPGASGLISSNMREVNKYVEEHPSCILVLWSWITMRYYVEENEVAVIGDKIDSPNILIYDDVSVEKFWNELKERLK